MNNISKEKTGHINYKSPYETSDTCGTCNGANCDDCKDIWFVEGVEDVFFTFEEAKKASTEAQSLVSYDGQNYTSPSAYTVRDGLLYAYIFIYGAPTEESVGYTWVPCNENSTLYVSKKEETLELMKEFDNCPITAKHLPSYANSCDVSMTCTKTCHHGCSKISFITDPTADAELTAEKEEEKKMYDYKFDHGIEISMIHNPNAGCNSGEYHTLYIKDMEFDACRCGNGCYGTVALNRLDDRDYVLVLLGEIEFDPYEECAVVSEYCRAKDYLLEKGLNPDEVKYFTHSTEPTGLGPIYKFVVRSFMSPMTLREENKKVLTALIEQKKTLSDFRDADIVETFETYNFDTAIDIMDTLTDLGYFKVYDLFREDDFEEEGGR